MRIPLTALFAAAPAVAASTELRRREESGERVFASPGELVRTLKAAAGARSYPKAKDAAFRMCEFYGRGDADTRGPDEARAWRVRAAAAGHAGAAVVAARMRKANG